MKSSDLLEPAASEEEAEMAKVALRCLMTALDHSNAPRIVLVDENGKQTDAPALPLPPKALRFFAEVLKLMAQQQPIMLLPQKHVLTTQEAAGFLNVSRPFVIKEIEQGRLPHRLVGTHRRIAIDDLMQYAQTMRANQKSALQRMADDAHELGLDY